jgi:hypothetical protein
MGRMAFMLSCIPIPQSRRKVGNGARVIAPGSAWIEHLQTKTCALVGACATKADSRSPWRSSALAGVVAAPPDPCAYAPVNGSFEKEGMTPRWRELSPPTAD